MCHSRLVQTVCFFYKSPKTSRLGRLESCARWGELSEYTLFLSKRNKGLLKKGFYLSPGDGIVGMYHDFIHIVLKFLVVKKKT